MHPAAVYQRTTHIVPAAHPRHPDTVKSPDIPLKLSVDEFSIVGAPASAFTLIFTHGNSFNKQFWTLIIDNLLSRPQLRQKIGRVLTVDTYNHGDSYLLNKNKDNITRTGLLVIRKESSLSLTRTSILAGRTTRLSGGVTALPMLQSSHWNWPLIRRGHSVSQA